MDMNSNDDTTYIDEFINQCLIDFINGEYEYNYGEDVAVGGLKAMHRYGIECSVSIQSSRAQHFAIYVNQNGSYYFYYGCMYNGVEPFQCFGPIEKFKDSIDSLIIFHALEAI